MNKLILFFASLASTCFSYTEITACNLLYIENLSKTDPQKAIQYANSFICDEHIQDKEKIHYIIMRSNIFIQMNNIEAFENDLELLRRYYLEKPECMREYQEYY